MKTLLGIALHTAVMAEVDGDTDMDALHIDLLTLTRQVEHLISLKRQTPGFRHVCDVDDLAVTCCVCGGQNTRSDFRRGTTYSGQRVYWCRPCEGDLYDAMAYGCPGVELLEG